MTPAEAKIDWLVDVLASPPWVRHVPRLIGFPLFVAWFLILLVPWSIALISVGLWVMFSEAR